MNFTVVTPGTPVPGQARRQPAELAPVCNKRYGTARLRGGRTRRELWGAETTDHVWKFDREDMPGTPWVLRHDPTGTDLDHLGSFDDCRWFVAAGHAEASLRRVQAHQRGEHGEKRDPACLKC